MRVAIHNHYAGQNVSETEFAKRIRTAACHLGWEAEEFGSSVEINRFSPDFVIALHFRTPKLTRFPTYGNMVTPPSFFADDRQFVRNVLSYDGYLYSSEHIKSWLKDSLYLTRKKYFIAPWYITSHFIPYRPPRIEAPRVVYAGTNWDGPRFGGLFARLDEQPYVDIYGPENAWSHIKHSYRGALPFDGVSILNALHEAGVGLCLHRREHCEAATPSSRIFEIAASGAIAICQEHPFIREVFRDSVLYLETTDDVAIAAAQIDEYMRWIADNQEKALDLSKRAYDVFARDFTLEKLLSDLLPNHNELCSRKTYTASPPIHALGPRSVQLIVRVGDRSTEYVERALESIRCQRYEGVGAIIVRYKDVPDLQRLVTRFRHEIPLELVESSYTGSRSTQLWDGLSAVSSEYFGILDDDDVIYPNHLNSLMQSLAQSRDCGVAYSGAIRVWEFESGHDSSAESPREPAELAYFEPWDLGELVALNNFITSNAFIARSSLLKELWDDPHLPLLEDLFLLLFLSRKTNFVFSYEATCEFRWRGSRTDNSVWMDRQNWAAARKRIENLLGKESFYAIQQVGHLSLSQLATKLVEAEAILAKVDATTTRLDRYLNSPFLRAIRGVRRKLLRLPPPEV